MRGKAGFLELNRVLHDRATAAHGLLNQLPAITMATIQPDWSLVLDGAPGVPFEWGAWGWGATWWPAGPDGDPAPVLTTTQPTSVPTHGTHVHDVLKLPLVIGDRVLVAVLGGVAPYVLERVD
jgi:hypothetical protein